MRKRDIQVLRVEDAASRNDALVVLGTTYLEEKRWVDTAESQLPESDLQSPTTSWFIAYVNDRPGGVLRVCYDPPVEQYHDYQVQLLDNSLDVDAFLRQNRIAEIGRFAVIPELRNQIMVAAELMRASTRETLDRAFTHYITDVFEDDPNSPYGFHTRVMGFLPVATHDVGELHCNSRRITMILDLKAAYQRLKARKNWIFRVITNGWDEGLHRRLAV